MSSSFFFFFFFNDTATTEIYTLSLHDALPICMDIAYLVGSNQVFYLGTDSSVLFGPGDTQATGAFTNSSVKRSEEHTSELQSRLHLVCRLLLEKKKKEIYCMYAGNNEIK